MRRSIEGGGFGFGPPKTKAGVRTIPPPQSVVELLAAHLAEFGAGDDRLIFTMETGALVPRNRWADKYKIACVAAGIDGDRTRTHDLRHVAASSLIAGGLSVAAVQTLLGHSSPAETLDVYTHFWPSEDKTRAAIESAAAVYLAR